ncbi:hypothetical protein BDY19DRAFT_913248 [Irpex rosettiformis]|uniref:Uncharacterized protein n=1 Tax=Irpex rosettiformis TaxID=378272 RepID=A0ACB8UJM9_9APHY|nr:hypothetical protein BDY19DRAFT_913248 [Irpex rosettiformis]
MSAVLFLLPFLFSFLLGRGNAQCTPQGSLSFRSPVTVAQGLSATVISANLTTPRGITIDSLGNILVIERGLGVTAFTDHDTTCDGWLRSVVVQNPSLTQGIQVHDNFLYVSTSGEVLRYTYNPEGRNISGPPVTLINNIPPDGELTTRPILLHPPEHPSIILVSSALAENIDPTARDPSSGRSQIRAFNFSSATTPAVQNFFSGSLVAFGIRNPAGFAFLPPQSFDSLWVVDNGASIDNVTGLTSAFVNDNPADELNLVKTPLFNNSSRNLFYGFPDCTTLWNPLADPVGDPQFTHLRTGAQFSLNLEPDRNDSWCVSSQNNVRPRLSFQAHSVPLDLKFYFPKLSPKRSNEQSTSSKFSRDWIGDAFVTFHGSFNRVPPTGYGVVRVPFSNSHPTANRFSNAGYTFLIQATNLTSCPGTCIRPVGIVFSEQGDKLFVTSDSSGELFVLSSE